MFFLDQTFMGNNLLTWAIAAGIFLVVYITLSLVRRMIGKRLAKLADATANDLDDLVTDLVRVRTKRFFFLALAVYAASTVLVLRPGAGKIIIGAVFVLLFLQVGLWGNGIINFFVSRRAARDGEEGLNLEAYSVITWIAKAGLWTIVILLALNNLGIQITALIAGLGISGIAVALALQNILGDLFASLSIVLDKPFIVGDFIIVGEQLGTVEHVGLKTTRVRSLSGEQIIFANNDLLNSRIKNYGRMNERRVLFGLGVTYQTPKDKLEKVPAIIRETIEAQDHVRFDRSNFSKFGAHSIDFETVYYVLDRDYNLYMNIQEKINLAIYERFGQESIEFAYPTQTLFLEKNG
jgi:small-conductance mechanosensitive channel